MRLAGIVLAAAVVAFAPPVAAERFQIGDWDGRVVAAAAGAPGPGRSCYMFATMTNLTDSSPAQSLPEGGRGGAAPQPADPFVLAGRTYSSRLLIGTGKFKDHDQTRQALEVSGAEIVTVALRRVELRPGQPSLLDAIDRRRYQLLPNTAGCYTADDAIRTLRLARELLDGHDLVKLEVLGDPQSLYPNVVETLKAAEVLIKDGFKVMVYTSDDPIVAKQLEDLGCVAVMPLASLIGSGMGILNPWNLQIIIDRLTVPVIVDAGVGTASDATIALELGCDAVLMNTAIAGAKNPVLMASAMKKAVEAGREAFLAGRMPRKVYQATPSSPTSGLIGS